MPLSTLSSFPTSQPRPPPLLSSNLPTRKYVNGPQTPQDGHVRVWDIRARKSVANVAAHTSEKGSGALAGFLSSEIVIFMFCWPPRAPPVKPHFEPPENAEATQITQTSFPSPFLKSR